MSNRREESVLWRGGEKLFEKCSREERDPCQVEEKERAGERRQGRSGEERACLSGEGESFVSARGGRVCWWMSERELVELESGRGRKLYRGEERVCVCVGERRKSVCVCQGGEKERLGGEI